MYEIVESNEVIERPLYNIFYDGINWFIVLPEVNCTNCYFKKLSCTKILAVHGLCVSPRSDGNSVIFKKLKMENNQIIIDVPDGMTIDTENSDLSKGIIKFKKGYITIDDIHVTIARTSDIYKYVDALDDSYAQHRDYLEAYTNLLDIAQYYNDLWKFDPTADDMTGYCIILNNINNAYPYAVRDMNTSDNVYFGQVMFKNKEDVKTVIDNPNFRSILDAVYKNK